MVSKDSMMLATAKTTTTPSFNEVQGLNDQRDVVQCHPVSVCHTSCISANPNLLTDRYNLPPISPAVAVAPFAASTASTTYTTMANYR